MAKAACKSLAAIAAVIGTSVSVGASLIQVGLSPQAGEALSSVNYANGDHAVGLSALNAVGQPASSGTGDVIGSGILFDDVTNVLSFEFAYGSDYGFTDMEGTYSTSHIHGPVAVQYPAENTGVGVAIPLDAYHTQGSTGNTGSYSGSVTLTSDQAANLLANLYYVNIHSSFAGGGELRAQLVPTAVIPEPATAGLVLIGTALLAGVRRLRSR